MKDDNIAVETILEKSLKQYKDTKTKEFLLSVEKRAKEAGVIPESYNILDKYLGRKYLPIGRVKSAGTKDMNTKGASQFEDRVKQLMQELENYRLDLPVMIGFINAIQTDPILLAGDHRISAMKRLKSFPKVLIDLLELNPDDENDRTMYDLISTNSNNHPAQWAMTKAELVSFIYRRITTIDKKMLTTFNPTQSTYDKKLCFNYIQLFKEPISKNILKSTLKDIHQKMSEGGLAGMFNNFVNEDEIAESNDNLGILEDEVRDVEMTMIHRNLIDATFDSKKEDRDINIVLTYTTSDFSMSTESLNKKRKTYMFSETSKSSAKSMIENFKLAPDLYEMSKRVKIIGFRAQVKGESITKLIRIDSKGVVSEVTYEQALKLPSMVT
jgi:hypothetical protein